MAKKNKCNHDLNSPDNTIDLFKRKLLTYPEIVFGICRCCKQSLAYTKTADGKFQERGLNNESNDC